MILYLEVFPLTCLSACQYLSSVYDSTGMQKRRANTSKIKSLTVPVQCYILLIELPRGSRHTQCMPCMIIRKWVCLPNAWQWGATSSVTNIIWALTGKAGTAHLQIVKPSTDLILIHHQKHSFSKKRECISLC